MHDAQEFEAKVADTRRLENEQKVLRRSPLIWRGAMCFASQFLFLVSLTRLI